MPGIAGGASRLTVCATTDFVRMGRHAARSPSTGTRNETEGCGEIARRAADGYGEISRRRDPPRAGRIPDLKCASGERDHDVAALPSAECDFRHTFQLPRRLTGALRK